MCSGLTKLNFAQTGQLSKNIVLVTLGSNGNAMIVVKDGSE